MNVKFHENKTIQNCLYKNLEFKTWWICPVIHFLENKHYICRNFTISVLQHWMINLSKILLWIQFLLTLILHYILKCFFHKYCYI